MCMLVVDRLFVGVVRLLGSQVWTSPIYDKIGGVFTNVWALFYRNVHGLWLLLPFFPLSAVIAKPFYGCTAKYCGSVGHTNLGAVFGQTV